jgi:hypothetical protein
MAPIEVKINVASPRGLRTQTRMQRVWGAELCPVCFTVRGSLQVERDTGDRDRYSQRCHCQRAGGTGERWSGFDFNTVVELCYGCGIEPIRSGSRWSIFFCSDCVDRAMTINRRHGQWIVPMGRHSVMHGAALSTEDAAEPFTRQVLNLSDAIDHLARYARDRVRRNALFLATALRLDFDPWDHTTGIDLAAYVGAARECGLRTQVAFEGFDGLVSERISGP